MGQTLLQTKKRIASISSTYKITSAMKLVSTVKLRKLMSKMENYRYYVNEISSIFDALLTGNEQFKNIYFETNTSKSNLYIVFSSSLGLCGSYNYNIFEILDDKINENDYLIIIGNKGKIHYKNFKNIIDLNLNESSYDEMNELLTEYILDNFAKGRFKEIYLVYTRYKNSITFIPTINQLLPISRNQTQKVGYNADVLIEPSKDEVLNLLIPLYVSSLIKGKILEAYTSEYASRRNAMENASDNAKEIIDELQLEFNKARQSQITNEIIDIVGASNAQKGE